MSYRTKERYTLRFKSDGSLCLTTLSWREARQYMNAYNPLLSTDRGFTDAQGLLNLERTTERVTY